MSAAPEHRAYKGCYVVVGHDQYDHSDYLVGHYISLSRAKKAARNKAPLFLSRTKYRLLTTIAKY